MPQKEKSYAQRVAEFMRKGSSGAKAQPKPKPKPKPKPTKKKPSIAKRINWPGA